MAERQAVAAAIRRASFAAQEAMQQLDARTAAELQTAYQAAAELIRGAIARAGQGQGRVMVGQLQALLAQVDQVLVALGTQRRSLIEAAVEQAALMGVEPLVQLQRAGAPGATAAAVQARTTEAVRFVRHFRAEDGLTLSDRIWRVGRSTRDAVTSAIEQAVVRGFSADQAAFEFISAGRGVPAETMAAQKASAVDAVAKGADLLHDPKGNALFNAQRVMRTEINRAHGEAYMAGLADVDGVVGFQFLLSPRHPRPDICDLLAKQNLHGLGAGVYPDRKSCPWPAHPNTLSFVVARLAHQVTDEDRAGRETTMQALDRLGPDIREGVLGPTKAEYFDRGLLRTGMVRSTVGAVRRRLER